jgi:hypothetical protein
MRVPPVCILVKEEMIEREREREGESTFSLVVIWHPSSS